MTAQLLALLTFTALASGQADARTSGLTVHQGESWIFVVDHGQPARPRRAQAPDKPRRGEIKVSLGAMMGTTMTIVSNNKMAFTYRAELIGAAKPVAARSCTLPAGNRLSFESWPQQATAVRLSDFKPAPKGGNCP